MKTLTGFYIFVLVTSIITLNNNLYNLLKPTIIVSIIGIVSAILFFMKKTSFYFLAIIWIIAQIPFIELGEQTIDLAQFLNFHFSLQFGSLSVGLNAQVLLLFLLKPIQLSEFLFREISFRAYTENKIWKIENEYNFRSEDIIDNKIIGTCKIEIDNIIYSKVELEPIKSERVKKAGIILIAENNQQTIKGTVQYKLNS
jgi:hypothetical protein